VIASDLICIHQDVRTSRPIVPEVAASKICLCPFFYCLGWCLHTAMEEVGVRAHVPAFHVHHDTLSIQAVPWGMASTRVELH
jgi:hypothetical protein